MTSTIGLPDLCGCVQGSKDQKEVRNFITPSFEPPSPNSNRQLSAPGPTPSPQFHDYFLAYRGFRCSAYLMGCESVCDVGVLWINAETDDFVFDARVTTFWGGGSDPHTNRKTSQEIVLWNNVDMTKAVVFMLFVVKCHRRIFGLWPPSATSALVSSLEILLRKVHRKSRKQGANIS